MKKRSLKDVYKKYPYIKKHEEGITRPSLKGCTINENHELSMTWRQWHEVIKIYLKYLKLYLLSGNQVTLPHQCGMMQLHKIKDGKQKMDFQHYNKTGEKKYFKNNHTDGYRPTFKWYRGKYEAKLKHRFHWAAVLVRTYRREISKATFDDPLLLLSYSTPSYLRRLKEVIKT